MIRYVYYDQKPTIRIKNNLYSIKIIVPIFDKNFLHNARKLV